MIPKQLQQEDFRFVLLKPKTKIPFENEWQKNGYKFNDTKLLEHIKSGGNYGVIGGYGNLRILDIDNQELSKEFLQKQGTFTVKTGSQGIHLYFICDYETNHVLTNKNGELRANNYQVVGANSTHPNGNKYQVLNDKSIKEISSEDLKELIKPYLREEHSNFKEVEEQNKDTSRSAFEYRRVIALIREGKTQGEVFQEMHKYSKWVAAPQGYKDMTYIKALGFVEKELKKNEEEKPEKEKGKKEISRIVDRENKIIVEQVYDEKNGSRFCIYNHNDGNVKYSKDYSYNGIKYFPVTGEEIEKKAVLLPSEAIEYIDNKTLDKEILKFANKWLDAPEETMRFGLWNVKVSYVFENFHTLNYLRAQGDTGTGKTRYLDVWGHLHYKPIFTTGTTTPAPLFRIIDKWRGTIVMDEADLRNSDESEQIIKILNQGFEQGKFIMRCDQMDATKLSFFDPFCPKILSTRRSFHDKATESRCITYITSVTERKDIKLNLNDDFFESALKLRNKLLMWRFKNYFEVDMDIDFDLGDIEPRVKQIVGSYISLFSSDKEQMEDFKKYIQSYQEELISERQSSFDGSIIETIHKILNNGIKDFDSKDIIEEGQFTDRNGKSMNPRSLTSRLKSLGFKKSESKRIGGKIKRCIPIEQKHVNKLFKRYGFSCYDVTVVTVVTGTTQKNINDVKVTKQQKMLRLGGSPHVP